MGKYLENATNFSDIEVKPKPAGRDRPCPKCQGYGKWNLLLNEYGEGKHFQSSCMQCWGWGWVKEIDADCIHDYKEMSEKQCRAERITHHGMCWHVIKCQKCQRITSYDSSD